MKRNNWTGIVVAAVLLVPVELTYSAVTIEPLDTVQGKYQLIYEMPFGKAGATESVFPPDGMASPDGKPEVLSVIRKDTGETMDYEVIPYNDGAYQVKTKFKRPIQKGEQYLLVYKMVVYVKENLYRDAVGRIVLRYNSRQDVRILMPKDHLPVFSSLPVTISEQQDRVALELKAQPGQRGQPSPPQALVVKMRPIGKPNAESSGTRTEQSPERR